MKKIATLGISIITLFMLTACSSATTTTSSSSSTSSTVASSSTSEPSSTEASSSVVASTTESSVSESATDSQSIASTAPTVSGDWTIAGTGMVYANPDKGTYFTAVKIPGNFRYMTLSDAQAAGYQRGHANGSAK
ncbi:MAG: hypothetical protein LBI13_06655 [Streptococcaceae bacterium]|jgi:hypothetical protein|nr:hypothetical protein [Streptococcaceae bacterium]